MVCWFKDSLLILLLLPVLAGAVDRDLDDCTVGSTPTAEAPLDLDACTIENGDDISGILSGLASTYGDVYVRAPSRTANVVAAYTVFTVDDFYFYEDQSAANKLTIQHVTVDPNTCSGAACKGFFTLWSFSNFDNVLIGGSNLSITFVGNHPGLGNCSVHYRPAVQTGYSASAATICDINYGFVEFLVTDSSIANLADFRANIRFSQGYALYTYGNGSGVMYTASTPNTIRNLNVAGSFYATNGTSFHTGVQNAWADPDRYVVSDPFMRMYGWTGEVPGKTQGGLPMGCQDSSNDQVRISGFGGYYTISITGGVTLEYGGGGVGQRYTNSVGSAESPFIVRLKDWEVTGPGTLYQAGVRVKKTGESTLFKGDPHDEGPDEPRRFIRFIKLPDDYGSGPAGDSLTGCAVDNNYADGISNAVRMENSVSPTRYTRGWDVEFAGDWRTPTNGGTFLRGQLFYFSWDQYRAYNNTIRIAPGTVVDDTITLVDTSTVTGGGTFTNLRAGHPGAQWPTGYGTSFPTSGTYYNYGFYRTDLNKPYLCRAADCNAGTGWQEQTSVGRANTITDTNVSGSIAVGGYAGTTTISNVNFSGAARAVITIDTGSTAVITDLCVPDGSTITGTGTLTYEGSSESLPFNIPNSTANCAITADGRPNAPSGGGVN